MKYSHTSAKHFHHSGRFIRLSLASCLLLVGFDKDYVASSGLLDEKESARMPSR